MDRKDFLKKSAGVVLGASVLGVSCNTSTEPKQIPQLGLNYDELPKSIKAIVSSDGELSLSMTNKKMSLKEKAQYRSVFKNKDVPQSEKNRLIKELRAKGFTIEQKKQFLKDVRSLAKKRNTEDNEPGDNLNIIHDDCIGCNACVPKCPFEYIEEDVCDEMPAIDSGGQYYTRCICGYDYSECGDYECVLACPTHSFNFVSGNDHCEN